MPVLDEMVTFQIEPDSLELVFLFDVQKRIHLSAGQPDPTEQARREAFRAKLDRGLLEDLIADRLEGDAVRGRVSFEPVAMVAKPPE